MGAISSGKSGKRNRLDARCEAILWTGVACDEPATDEHHIIFRSHGGHKGPTSMLCRGHHMAMHGIRHANRRYWRKEWIDAAKVSRSRS